MNYDFDVIARSWEYLFKEGMSFTLTLTALSMVGGVVLGTALALMRLSPIKPLSAFAGAYVNLMRSLPLVLVIFWFFFLVPWLGAWILGSKDPIKVGAFARALITFTLFEAAFFCEIMRAGIQSIPSGQISAAYAIGLNYRQAMTHVVLPQAFRNMLPVLMTQTIILFQDTSLVYAIGAYDLLKGFTNAGKIYGRSEEAYIFAAVVYFVICFALSWSVKRLQAKIAIVR